MASSLSQGPLFSAVRSNTAVSRFYFPVVSGSCQCRSFSQASQRNGRQPVNMGTPKTPTPLKPSTATRGSMMSRSELPTDLGLLPGTFIRPLWRDLPSIFTHPKERLQLEWLWLKSGFQSFASVIVYSKITFKGLPLRFRERRQVARDLHQRMYTAFAAGDVPTIRKLCCTGFANDLTSRITSRAKDEAVTWSLTKYNRTPATLFTGVRVLADRATQIPEIPDSGVRQVVVRITSRQETSKMRVVSAPAPTPAGPGPRKTQPQTRALEPVGPAKQQDCTEYLVFQKLRWFGQEEDWRVWGHTTPTTVEDLYSNPMFAPGLSLAERMQHAQDMYQGKK
ncbi:hypothetical protein BDV59DRAFT_15185 [Aspergillus ambiguus]|uniref:uncharacterized protein n=1 Tax=Aspergillus ambiguus TaxID=176160 RepID=UPI003CCD2ED0